MNNKLYSSFTLGDLKLSNRMVMAPMTRNRAARGGLPTDLMAEYYRQRATAGLIITEASQISADAVGYPRTPGIYNDQQVTSWSKVTDAVHKEGGHIFIQLWYCGRISHPSLLPDGQQPVAPSAITPAGKSVTYAGMQPYVEPRALLINEIPDIVDQYRHAAEQAKLAGFDGIEVHAANGYIIDQFLRDGSNHRSDKYGGTIENRMRFLNEVLDAIGEVWKSNRIGVRLTPENRYNSMSDSDPFNHFGYVISQLNKRKLAYLHMLEGDMVAQQRTLDYRVLRNIYEGTYMANQGYNQQNAEQAMLENSSDLIAFGVPFLANPDLVSRFKAGLALNSANKDTFYGGDERGYTDYPFLNEPVSEPESSGN